MRALSPTSLRSQPTQGNVDQNTKDDTIYYMIRIIYLQLDLAVLDNSGSNQQYYLFGGACARAARKNLVYLGLWVPVLPVW